MKNILQIRVIYFAKLRDLIGLEEEILSIEEGDDPSDVLASINKKHKIDIGAVFNMAPSRHLSCGDKKAFVPMEKEMVFDIDMDAYDDVRSCCSGANVCQKCWSYLNIAAKLLCTDLTP